MNNDQKRAFEALRRVALWLDANGSLVPAELAGQVETIRGTTAALAAGAASQQHESRGAQSTTVVIRTRRSELRSRQLVPLARVARAVVELTPELRAALRVPAAHSDDETLIAAASAMAAIGEAHQDLLVAHGLPTDFVARLRAATAALRAAIDERGQGRSRGVGATQGIRAVLVRARRAVLALDVAFTRLLADDPARLATWRNAKRQTGTAPRGAVEVATAPAPQAA